VVVFLLIDFCSKP